MLIGERLVGFVGGTLGPIFSFLALIALLLTIVLQGKELEAVKIELGRSASAQENSERAMAISNYSTTLMSLSEAQKSLHLVAKDAASDSTILQQYMVKISYVRQLETVLSEQRKDLAHRGIAELAEQHDSYDKVFGPLINLLPIDLSHKVANEYDSNPDPDFHFFLTSFIDAAYKTDLPKNHMTRFKMRAIKKIVDESNDDMVVDYDQRIKLQKLFIELLEVWAVEGFATNPHEFKMNQRTV